MNILAIIIMNDNKSNSRSQHDGEHLISILAMILSIGSTIRNDALQARKIAPSLSMETAIKCWYKYVGGHNGRIGYNVLL